MAVIITKDNFRQHKAACGGKAYNLFVLQEEGFAIPKLIVLPPSTIDQLLGDRSGKINALAQKAPSSADLEMMVKQLRSAELDAEILQEIKKALHHELDGSLFAVRSSVNVEDSSQHSFAGIFESFINVPEAELAEKILACIAALYKPRVCEYAANAGLSFGNIRPSLIVQEMVKAEKSGILFTMNALGNYKDSHITAAFGYCEDIVQGKVATESYLIDRQTSEIAQEELSSVLTKAEILSVFEAGMASEKLFGHPQDIEFSFDEKGRLRLLQSRPITTIHLDRLKILDNSNIVESYPGITLPLSFSFAKSAYRGVFSAAAKLFGLSGFQVAELEPKLSEMIAHEKGRVYYQLHHWYALMGIIISSKSSFKAWETLIGVQRSHAYARSESFLKSIKNSYTIAKLFFGYKSIVKRFYLDFERNYQSLRAMADASATRSLQPCALMKWYQDFSKVMFESWAPTLMNDFFTFKFFDWLKARVATLGIEDAQVANDLLVGLEGVDSEKPVLALLKLKEEINKDAQLSALFQNKPSAVLEGLKENGFASFRAKVDHYISLYGDRTLNELKMESLNFRIRPESFIELLQSQLQNAHETGTFKAKQKAIAQEAMNRIKAAKKYRGVQKRLFDYILKMAKTTLRHRENMRFRRAQAYGAVKELFYNIGVHFEHVGILKHRQDVFFLTVTELQRLACSDAGETLASLIENRKHEFNAFSAISMPDRIIFEGDFPNVIPSVFHAEDSENLSGLPISKGLVRAEVLVLDHADFNAQADGKILVTQYTDPAWVFLMTRAAGIITEKGSPLSHTAIVGRELGIPVIVNVRNATRILKSGQLISMDGSSGTIQL